MPFDGVLNQDDEILRVLRAAQERIRKPENWCQNLMHLTTDDGTDQWCARGAIWCFDGDVAADNLLCRAASEMGYGDPPSRHGTVHERHQVVTLNNTTDHPTVMAMFSRAIELRLAEIMETVAS